jgi:hypothetical protein
MDSLGSLRGKVFWDVHWESGRQGGEELWELARLFTELAIHIGRVRAGRRGFLLGPRSSPPASGAQATAKITHLGDALPTLGLVS